MNIANRSSKTIVSVQVRVEVFNLNEREKILLEEALPFANASVPPNDSQVVEIKTLYPPRLLKAIAKGGELNGKFGIWIIVQAVRFADGTFWSEQVVWVVQSKGSAPAPGHPLYPKVRRTAKAYYL